VTFLCAFLLWASPVLAQPAPPAADANEDPADVEARVRYERAVRADFDGRPDDAIREAQACMEAKPDGRFAAASRALIERLHGEPRAPVRSTGVGPRTELIISSTATGLYLSSLVAGAANTSSKEAVALLMAGTGGALLASIFASADRRVPQSMPQMLQNGVLFGTEATLLAYAIADPHASNFAGSVAAGVLGGTVLGLGSAPYLSGGDSGAITTGIVVGGGLPALITGAVQGRTGNGTPVAWAALLGSTAGIIVGPILNGRVHASRGRWNLISLGGEVGALMGAGVGVLADAFQGSARGGLLLTAAGTVGGLALMAFLTQDFGGDEPRPGSAGLLHVEDGKLSVGEVPAALSPARVQGRSAAYLRLLDGRF
jgi:hypothetical protein